MYNLLHVMLDDNLLSYGPQIVMYYLYVYMGNSSVTRVTFCNFWTLKSNILFTILLFSNPSCVCVLVDIRILYNMTLTEMYLIKDYAFNYN